MCIFALITMYDAMGVRRAAGQHAKEINRINRLMESFSQIKNQINPAAKPIENITQVANSQIKALKEYLGHTPFEVVSGALLGIAFAFVMPMSIQ